MKTTEDYIKYKLEKADESLKAAEILLSNKSAANAISLMYYAAFYAVSALLINRNLNPKTHKGAKALFHKEFIFTKEFDPDFGNFYDNLLAKRFDVDYEYYPLIDEKSLPDQLEKTKQLIDLIKKKLQTK